MAGRGKEVYRKRKGQRKGGESFVVISYNGMSLPQEKRKAHRTQDVGEAYKAQEVAEPYKIHRAPP